MHGIFFSCVGTLAGQQRKYRRHIFSVKNEYIQRKKSNIEYIYNAIFS